MSEIVPVSIDFTKTTSTSSVYLENSRTITMPLKEKTPSNFVTTLFLRMGNWELPLILVTAPQGETRSPLKGGISRRSSFTPSRRVR